MTPELLPLLRSLIEKHKDITTLALTTEPVFDDGISTEVTFLEHVDGREHPIVLASVFHDEADDPKLLVNRENAEAFARAIADLPTMLDAMRAAVLELEAMRENDARWEFFRENIAPRPLSQILNVPWTDIPPEMTIASKVDMVCDAARSAPLTDKG